MFNEPRTRDVDVGIYGTMKELKLRPNKGTWADRRFSLYENSKMILENENYLKVLFTLKNKNLVNPVIREEVNTENNFSVHGTGLKKYSKSLKESKIVIINKAGKNLSEQLVCEAELFRLVYDALADQRSDLESTPVPENDIIDTVQSITPVDVIVADDIDDGNDLIGIFDAVEEIAKNATALNQNNENEFMWQNQANLQPDPYSEEEDIFLDQDTDFEFVESDATDMVLNIVKSADFERTLDYYFPDAIPSKDQFKKLVSKVKERLHPDIQLDWNSVDFSKLQNYLTSYLFPIV